MCWSRRAPTLIENRHGRKTQSFCLQSQVFVKMLSLNPYAIFWFSHGPVKVLVLFLLQGSLTFLNAFELPRWYAVAFWHALRIQHTSKLFNVFGVKESYSWLFFSPVFWWTVWSWQAVLQAHLWWPCLRGHGKYMLCFEIAVAQLACSLRWEYFGGGWGNGFNNRRLSSLTQ